MRLDKGILEQVETLEEKVVSASMQVKVSYTEKCVCKMWCVFQKVAQILQNLYAWVAWHRYVGEYPPFTIKWALKMYRRSLNYRNDSLKL